MVEQIIYAGLEDAWACHSNLKWIYLHEVLLYLLHPKYEWLPVQWFKRVIRVRCDVLNVCHIMLYRAINTVKCG